MHVDAMVSRVPIHNGTLREGDVCYIPAGYLVLTLSTQAFVMSATASSLSTAVPESSRWSLAAMVLFVDSLKIENQAEAAVVKMLKQTLSDIGGRPEGPEPSFENDSLLSQSAEELNGATSPGAKSPAAASPPATSPPGTPPAATPPAATSPLAVSPEAHNDKTLLDALGNDAQPVAVGGLQAPFGGQPVSPPPPPPKLTLGHFKEPCIVPPPAKSLSAAALPPSQAPMAKMQFGQGALPVCLPAKHPPQQLQGIMPFADQTAWSAFGWTQTGQQAGGAWQGDQSQSGEFQWQPQWQQ